MIKLNPTIHPKLSEILIERLQGRGISTVLEFILADLDVLQNLTSLCFKEILEIKQCISDLYGGKVKTGHELFNTEQCNLVVTGIKSLDILLEGGLYPGQIYELCGLSGCGKSQLCLTIASNVAQREKSIVRYIDTKKDFSGSRVEEILTNKNSSQQVIDQVMERIKVCSIQRMSQLLGVLHWLGSALQKEGEEFSTKLIIIDSLPALIFKFWNDDETVYILNQLANRCHYLANEFKLAIVIVNIITQWNYHKSINEAGNVTKEHTIIRPALGKYWSRVPNTRLFMQKEKPGCCRAVVWSSFRLEKNTGCVLNVGEAGVC